MLLTDFVESYALSHDIRESTIEQYRTTAQVLSKWNKEPIKIKTLSDEVVNRFLRDYAVTAKPHTVASKRRQILALWRAASDEGFCSAPKKIREIRLPETRRDVWTAEQVKSLAEACEKITGRIPESEIQTGLALAALVRTAWDTGMRRADLFRLERAHAEYDGWLEIVQIKTGRLVLCRLSEHTKKLVIRTFDDWAPPRKLIWPGGALVARRLSSMVADVAEDIGLSCNGKPFKKLRRSSITAVEQVAPGTGYLQAGHTTSQTTIRFYLNPAIAQMARPMPPTL
jgi:integrase